MATTLQQQHREEIQLDTLEFWDEAKDDFELVLFPIEGEEEMDTDMLWLYKLLMWVSIVVCLLLVSCVARRFRRYWWRGDWTLLMPASVVTFIRTGYVGDFADLEQGLPAHHTPVLAAPRWDYVLRLVGTPMSATGDFLWWAGRKMLGYDQPYAPPDHVRAYEVDNPYVARAVHIFALLGKARFGVPRDTEANRLAVRSFIERAMRDRDMRVVDIARHVDPAVALVFVPTYTESQARMLLQDRAVRALLAEYHLGPNPQSPF